MGVWIIFIFNIIYMKKTKKQTKKTKQKIKKQTKKKLEKYRWKIQDYINIKKRLMLLKLE